MNFQVHIFVCGVWGCGEGQDWLSFRRSYSAVNEIAGSVYVG